MNHSVIFGITVDFFSRPGVANWKLGDQCYTPNTAGDALRFMDNPNAAGDPDTYLGTYWYTGTGDNGGVHTNSGVQNYWYYLLSVGGAGTNDVGFNFNVSGITIEKARLIAYRNNTFYLTSGSQYSDAAFYSLQAATDLYGNCSAEAFSVKNAWDAVNVMGLQLNAAATVSAGPVCNGGTIQLNAAGGTTFVWSGPGGFSSTAQNPVILNAAAGNAGSYSCLITNANGCSSSKSVTVSVNPSPSVSAIGGASICAGASVNLSSTATVPGTGNSSGSNSTLINIPDANQTGISSPITIGKATSAASIISVTIDSLVHPYTGDLVIRLEAPNGSFITLASGVGGAGDNFYNTVFSSSAVNPIAGGVAPFTGTFLPQQAFSSLTGSADGIWNLRVIDAYSQDIGSLQKWSIVLSPNTIISYSWSPVTGLSSSTTQNTVASPAVSTTYSVVVTDAFGCSSTASTSVTISTPVATTTVSNPSCAGQTGSISTNVTGGFAPYTYLWSEGSTGASLLNAPGGFYSVVITDATGCSVTAFNSISTPLALSLGIGSSDATCGNSDGSISLSVSGGAQPYSYLWSNSSTTPAIQNLAPGLYSVVVTDANGCTILGDALIGSTGGVAPNPPGPVTGPIGACRSQLAVNFNVAPVNGALSYVWTMPAGATGISTSNSIVVDFNSNYSGGAVCVSAVGACGQSAPTCYNISYFAGVPPTPAAITGPAFACAGSTQVFTCSTSLNAESYTWTLPANATLISGQGTTTATISFASNFVSGAIKVNAVNCKGASGIRSRTFYGKPTTPGTMTGAANGVCANASGTYSVPAIISATAYNWTVPATTTIISGQGTNSISVSFGPNFTSGSVAVTASNSCGTSAARALAVKSITATPGTISGIATAVCVGTNANYSITAVAGAVSYNWSVPANAVILSGQGSNLINVQFNPGFVSGSITVAAVNGCGASALRSLAISSAPATPGTMTGSASNLCSQSGVVYSVAAVPNATSYNWSVPSFATIVSGQGTNSITVSYSAVSGSGGSVCVVANNVCGASTSRCLTSVSTLPLRPPVITGPAAVCTGQQNVAYNVVSQPGANYNWTVPSGGTIFSGQGTGAILVNWGAVAGSVAVVASNSCGAQSARTLAVAINCRLTGSADIDLELFPNPARAITHVKWNGIEGVATILVTDITGKVVLTERMVSNETDLDISMLNAGIYTVKIIASDRSEKIARLAVE
ncbi:MAG: M4 family metallopeptidase [Bacteroidetes bacterium]|nr:M4 family metallopeptidase [Bacteroidota bacterium]